MRPTGLSGYSGSRYRKSLCFVQQKMSEDYCKDKEGAIDYEHGSVRIRIRWHCKKFYEKV